MGELGELQRAMLERASGWLAPGGRLVYAVCSLEPEEGEAQAKAFDLLTPEPVADAELPGGIAAANGYFRADPGMLSEAGGIDGFFAARWMKA